MLQVGKDKPKAAPPVQEQLGRSQEIVLVSGTYDEAGVLLGQAGRLIVGLRVHTEGDYLVDDATFETMMETLRGTLASFQHDFQIYIGTRQQDLSPAIEDYKKALTHWQTKLNHLRRVREYIGEYITQLYHLSKASPELEAEKCIELFRARTGVYPEEFEQMPGLTSTVIYECIYVIKDDIAQYDEEGLNALIEVVNDSLDQGIKLVEHYISILYQRGMLLENIQTGPRMPVRDVVIIIPKMYQIGPMSLSRLLERAYKEALDARETLARAFTRINFSVEYLKAEDLLALIRGLYHRPTSSTIMRQEVNEAKRHAFLG